MKAIMIIRTTALILALITVFTTTAAALSCGDGDICVNETGWWRDGSTFNANGTAIQAAVDNANAGETICVRDGTYSENVNVNVAHLTIRSQNGSANCTVAASDSGDHVFEVTVDYVNISGFTVENATLFFMAGMYLGANVDHCNISDNSLTNNWAGIYLYTSSNNTLTENTANSNDWCGIHLDESCNNTLTKNTANSNSQYGIYLESSSNNNTLTENTVDSNSRGIYLDSSSNNTLTSNTASNNGCGIHLDDSSDNNTLTSNTANSNKYGIYLQYSSDNNTLTSNTANSNGEYGIHLWSSSNNTLTESTANSNNYYGIHLRNADDNNVSCNWVQNNTGAGFYLKGGSTGNTIERNNIIANGVSQGGGIYHYQFYNNQDNPVDAKNNYWGPGMVTNETIDPSIYDNEDEKGEVTFYPFETGPVPCAPIPELSTVLLLAVGLLMLAGYVRAGRRK